MLCSAFHVSFKIQGSIMQYLLGKLICYNKINAVTIKITEPLRNMPHTWPIYNNLGFCCGLNILKKVPSTKKDQVAFGLTILSL